MKTNKPKNTPKTLSTNELRAELARRENLKYTWNVRALEGFSAAEKIALFDKIYNAFLESINYAVNDEYLDDDQEGYLFEKVALTLFGKDYYDKFSIPMTNGRRVRIKKVLK